MKLTGIHRAYVVKGSYPELLLQLWDTYTTVKESENVRPGQNISHCYLLLANTVFQDVLPPSTHYAIVVLPNGGADLEAYPFPQRNPWKTAVSIMWQVTRALAVAEDRYQFEVRRLRWPGWTLAERSLAIA